MKNKYNLALLVLAVVLIGWLSWYFSDKQVIKRQLIELSWNLSKKGDESTMEMALKMREIKLLLAAESLVVIPERNYSESLGQDMIIRYLMYYRDLHEILTVTFEGMVIDIPDKGEARVESAVVLLKQYLGKTAVKVHAPVELMLHKQDKKWLLRKATVPEILVE
jgi:hypothetical protein